MAVKGIDIQISANGAAAEAALLRVNEHLKGTGTAGKQAASEISEAMHKMEDALGMVGVTIGLGEAINMMKEAVTSSLEFGEAIERASQKTGLAAGTLSTLHYAAAVIGGDFDGMTSAVAKMDKSIGQATEGNKPALAFMKSLGLNAKELAGRSDGAEMAFKRFTTTLAATENPIRRVELATALLGKAGASQIPMLIDVGNHWDEYKQKAMDAGVYLDGAGAASLAETNQKLNDMKQHLVGAGLGLTEGFTPPLINMLNVMASGKTPMETMITLGDKIARTFAFVAEALYSAAAAAEVMFAASEGGGFTKWGQADTKAASDLLDKANKMYDISFGPDVQNGNSQKVIAGAGKTGIVGMGGEMASVGASKTHGGFEGIDAGGGGAGGGKGSKSKAKTATEDQIPIDLTAVEAERRAARKAHDEMQAVRDSLGPKAPPPINMTNNGAAMAAGEKLRLQTEALQALDIKGDTIKRESGLIETQIQQKSLTGTLSKQAALQQLDTEHMTEIARLQALAVEYAQYGEAGRDAYAKIEGEITHTMQSMEKQDKQGDQAFKGLGDGVTSMAEKMAQATGKGRQGFHAMAMSMEADLVELAVKFAAQKWLAPFMNSLGAGVKGGGGGVDPTAGADLSSLRGYASGGDPTGPSIVGEKGPELFFPKGPGTVMPTDALQNLSRSSGGGGAPSMTMNVTNASSQPVTARQTGSSFDADTRSYMTHVILEDLSQGGPISSALRPGG